MTHTIAPTQAHLPINADRLNQSIEQLANIGQLPQGGVSRVAFTPPDLQARDWIRSQMQNAGMTVRVDAAGNIIGRYAGLHDQLPAFATGSHIDTVPVAGRYDGCLGVLAGIEVVRVLQERSLRLQHPLEVIVFTDEERSVIGSKAMAGEVLDDPNHYVRLDGTPIQTCLEQIGGNWSEIKSAKRDRTEIAAFVELHVEQGGVLEQAGRAIGIVNAVVGQYRFSVSIIGRANHAGTTPMNLRKDALVAAAQIILAVNRIAIETPGDQVATVGYLEVHPNATNTVPGKVELRIDLRDRSQSHLEMLIDRLNTEIAAIATAIDTTIVMQQTLHIRPTLAAAKIMAAIVQVCDDLGWSQMELPSRAGHDAQEIGRITDMGMIFVPSLAGVSHSADEYTAPEQCVQGTQVLLQTFLRLDQNY